MKRFALPFAWMLLVGCESPPNTDDVQQDASANETTADDADPSIDVVTTPDIPDVPQLDSGCPPSQTLTPANLPAGYFAPITVRLNQNVDGDTAHFQFADGDKTVRFLYVNTEESHGADTTAFGMLTAQVVAGYLISATTIQVVPRQAPNQPAGTWETDIFGRTLGLVYVNGELFQQRLVREGWSAYFTEFGCAPEPIHSALLRAEAEANANDRGIWAPGHPTDYRVVLARWIGTRTCRPNPYVTPYCR